MAKNRLLIIGQMGYLTRNGATETLYLEDEWYFLLNDLINLFTQYRIPLTTPVKLPISGGLILEWDNEGI